MMCPNFLLFLSTLRPVAKRKKNYIVEKMPVVEETPLLFYSNKKSVILNFVSYLLFSYTLLPEHPSLIPPHSATLFPSGTCVVWHDAGVPLESHHSNRQRRPWRQSGTEKTRNSSGGERDQGKLFPVPGFPVCACMQACVYQSQKSSMYVTVLLFCHVITSLMPCCKCWLTF